MSRSGNSDFVVEAQARHVNELFEKIKVLREEVKELKSTVSYLEDEIMNCDGSCNTDPCAPS